MPTLFRTTHLIEEYKVKANTILCCCGWFGSANGLRYHQQTSEPTELKPSPSPYSADRFNRPNPSP